MVRKFYDRFIEYLYNYFELLDRFEDCLDLSKHFFVSVRKLLGQFITFGEHFDQYKYFLGCCSACSSGSNTFLFRLKKNFLGNKFLPDGRNFGPLDRIYGQVNRILGLNYRNFRSVDRIWGQFFLLFCAGFSKIFGRFVEILGPLIDYFC